MLFHFYPELCDVNFSFNIQFLLLLQNAYIVVPGIVIYNFQNSKKSTWTDRKFWKINMSRDGIIGSLLDNFHYFMTSQSEKL